MSNACTHVSHINMISLDLERQVSTVVILLIVVHNYSQKCCLPAAKSTSHSSKTKEMSISLNFPKR